MEHIKIQREGEQACHVGTIEVRQDRYARFRSFSFAVGAALSRTNIYSVMSGEGADCTLNGLYMGHGTQHVDHQTRIEHAAPSCTSREVYKGVLDGQSHGVFNGKVYVRPEAQKTDGKQTNRNLLLSDGARVDTKPQLEIFADDVKCTHGATVGRLDDLGTFYLRSRGITPDLARRMLTYGFAEEVLVEVQPGAGPAGTGADHLPAAGSPGAGVTMATGMRADAPSPARPGLDVARIRRDFPILETTGSRPSAGLSRQRRHQPEAPQRHRRGG